MRDFEFVVAASIPDVFLAGEDTAYLAGGTGLVDLMKLGVARPRVVVDINSLPLRDIVADQNGLTIGALARMSDVADDPHVRRDHPVIVDALLAGASQQLRNMASIGGNLLQRTRCGYFRNVAAQCNRRDPGSGCSAIDGSHRAHAILGTSSACVATHPSDLAVALLASDAEITLVGPHGARVVPIDDLFLTPGNAPHLENAVLPGELLTQVRVPPAPTGARATYVKVRARASYEFALTSAAVRLVLTDGVVTQARVAVGGVATIPWRLPEVETALVGRQVTAQNIETAAALASRGARPLTHNAFKVPLLQRTVARAIEEVVLNYDAT